MPRPRKNRSSAPQPETRMAALYARVSTVEQREEGYSVEAQVRILREYCEREGLPISTLYTEAETAKRAGRAEFGRMLREARRTCVTDIVVEKTDRIYRNLPDMVKVDELGVNLHLVKEGKVVGPRSNSSENFVHLINVAMARNYVQNLGEEASKGMRQKALQGVWPTHAPFGYLNVGEGARRVIAPDPKNAPWVRRAFETYAGGDATLKEVARTLAAAGAIARKNPLGATGIHAMLRNPIYKGVVRWNGEEYPGTHEPIVPRALWDRVQLALAGRNPSEAGGVSRSTGDYAYRGLVKCGVCGCLASPYTAKGRYVYYSCSGAKGCRRLGIREEAVASALDGLRIRQSVLDLLREGLREGHKERSEAVARARSELRARIDEKTELLERIYIDRLSNPAHEAVSRGLWERTQRELEDAKAAFEASSSAERASWEQDLALLRAASESADVFRQASPEHRREFVKGAVSNLEIHGREIRVELSPGFRMVLEANEKSGLNVTLEAQLESWLPTVDSNHD